MTPARRGSRALLGVRAPELALMAFVAVAGTLTLRAYDLFWHLAAGRWILEHGALPETDPFRFTSHEEPWVDHEWLFQVLLRGVELLGGVEGLVLARTAAVLLLAATLLLALRRAGAPAAGAVLVCAAAILGARPRFMLRPELASLVGTVLLLALLQRARRGASPRPLLLAFPLVVLWANLHPGVLLAPPVAGAYLIGSRLPGGGGAGRGGERHLSWAVVIGFPAACLAAIALNPAGLEIFTVPFRIGAALSGLGAVNPEWAPAWAAPQPALIAGALGVGGLAVVAWRRTGRLDPATGLATLVLSLLAVSGVRHQGLFFMGAAFLAGEALADLGRRGERIGGQRARLAAVSACLLAAVWCLFPPPLGPLRPRQGPMRFGLGIEPGRFPESAAERVAEMPGLGPVYNDVAFGGYLLWRLYPPRQVFIDGRNEVNPGLLSEMARSRPDAAAWNDLLDCEGVDGALVRYEDRALPVLIPPGEEGGEARVEHHTASAVLFPLESYALVYWDDAAMLFLRRREERSESLASLEYRFVHPEDREATLARARLDPRFRAGVIEELARRLAEKPPSRRALQLLEDLGMASVSE